MDAEKQFLNGKGHLLISTLKDGDRYIDGCVRTKGKFSHSFGYYTARVKLQGQPGHWSAFWIMGDGVGKVGSGGRDGTEIDIYEKPWLNDRVQHTLHWDGYGKDHKSQGKVVKVPGVMDGWHTFGLWWKPDEYVFYVDGKEDVAHEGERRVPGSRIYQVKRRDRQMGGRYRQSQTARRIRGRLRAGLRYGGKETGGEGPQCPRLRQGRRAERAEACGTLSNPDYSVRREKVLVSRGCKSHPATGRSSRKQSERQWR